MDTRLNSMTVLCAFFLVVFCGRDVRYTDMCDFLVDSGNIHSVLLQVFHDIRTRPYVFVFEFLPDCPIIVDSMLSYTSCGKTVCPHLFPGSSSSSSSDCWPTSLSGVSVCHKSTHSRVHPEDSSDSHLYLTLFSVCLGPWSSHLYAILTYMHISEYRYLVVRLSVVVFWPLGTYLVGSHRWTS